MKEDLSQQMINRFNEIRLPKEVFADSGDAHNFLHKGYILFMRDTKPDEADIALMNPRSEVPFSEIDETP